MTVVGLLHPGEMGLFVWPPHAADVAREAAGFSGIFAAAEVFRRVAEES